MPIVLMFMLATTITPFIFIHLKKTTLAIVQTALLVGMWLYFFEAMFDIAPAPFSFLWFLFYGSLVISEAGWIMLIIDIVKSGEKPNNRSSYQ
ncbi:hypothetical protein [Tuberibacillus sp. Marseille-P3662]|uniref:hypothetical protein n=1 Tax=Tuberibacillus sp. Marseille-P3662 TaxID=1965358 RepID=UPI000A1CBC13|nr:hypothetical protein [Tuberibacillus sp. Marseille-P3662]